MSASYLDWKAGDKVVCLTSDWTREPGETTPVKGGVYTLRSIDPDEGDICIRVEEIRNPPLCDGDMECYFNAQYFRRVQPRRTDISVFTALLNPTKQDREDIELADFIIEHALPMEQIR